MASGRWKSYSAGCCRPSAGLCFTWPCKHNLGGQKERRSSEASHPFLFPLSRLHSSLAKPLLEVKEEPVTSVITLYGRLYSRSSYFTSPVISVQRDCVKMTPYSAGTQPKDCWSRVLSHIVLLGGSFPFILRETSHLAIRIDENLCINFTRLRSAP